MEYAIDVITADELVFGLNAFWTIFNAVVLFGGGFWYGKKFRELMAVEEKIFKKKDEIDNIESDATSKRTLGSGLVNQVQFEKMTEKRRKPLEAELETLKMKRQFILDKMPLLSFFKK